MTLILVIASSSLVRKATQNVLGFLLMDSFLFLAQLMDLLRYIHLGIYTFLLIEKRFSKMVTDL